MFYSLHIPLLSLSLLFLKQMSPLMRRQWGPRLRKRVMWRHCTAGWKWGASHYTQGRGTGTFDQGKSNLPSFLVSSATFWSATSSFPFLFLFLFYRDWIYYSGPVCCLKRHSGWKGRHNTWRWRGWRSWRQQLLVQRWRVCMGFWGEQYCTPPYPHLHLLLRKVATPPPPTFPICPLRNPWNLKPLFLQSRHWNPPPLQPLQ